MPDDTARSVEGWPSEGLLQPLVRERLGAVQRLIGAVFAEYGFQLDLDDMDRYLRDPAPVFRRNGGELRTLLDRCGVLRGTVGCVLHADFGELRTLYLERGWRNRGWGRRLTLYAMDYARRAGRRRMLLWSDTRFRAAHRLYERLGFELRASRTLHDGRTCEYGFQRSLV